MCFGWFDDYTRLCSCVGCRLRHVGRHGPLRLGGRDDGLIVPDALWVAVRSRLEGVKQRIEQAAGKPLGGRRRDIDSRYLMPGFARCGVCGGAFCVMSRAHGKNQRGYFYGCAANHKRGAAVCTNSEVVLMDHVDGAVLDALGFELRPEIVEAVLKGVFDAISAAPATGEAERLRRKLASVDQEAARLATAIATGGDLAPLLTLLQASQQQRQELALALVSAEQQPPSKLDRGRIEHEIRRKLRDWRGLLTRNVEDGRELFRQVLSGPVRLWPVEGERRTFRFEGTADLGRLFAGVAGLATFLASPTGILDGASIPQRLANY